MLFHSHESAYQKLVTLEGERWGEEKGDTRLSWFDSPMIYRYINRQISGKPHIDWMDYIKKNYFKKPAELGLTAGCGHGDAERHILKRNITQKMDAFDISPKAIELAKDRLNNESYAEQVRYFVGDANYLEKAPLADSYDVIFGVMSLHHFAYLENCLDHLSQHLKPGGYFIADEFIGPDRFQWSDAQVDAANRILACFPLELRRYIMNEKEYKLTIPRPTVKEMEKYQAFEAVCSERIIPSIKERFQVVEIKYYGGTVLHLLFEGIMGNFREEWDREHALMVRMAIETEHLLLDNGVLPHDHALIIAKKV